MGRLFWKFFFVFWLTLLIAGLTVGSAVWLRHTDNTHEQGKDLHFEATTFLMMAEDIHQSGGDKALISYIEGIQNTIFPDIYAIDDMGNDILNRPVSTEVVKAAREILDKYPVSGPVKKITAQGKSYLLFALQIDDYNPLPPLSASTLYPTVTATSTKTITTILTCVHWFI